MIAGLMIVVLVSYLAGSIPFGLLLTRAAGLGDIRAIGSGNIGATNVLRTGKRGLAAATLALDAAKAALPILLATRIAGPQAADVAPPLAAAAAILGHCFPVWLKFDGGKGVASGLGALLALDWRLGLACAAVWLTTVLITRISSAGAVAATLLAPVFAIWLLPPLWFLSPALIGLVILWRHRANISRLLAGTEPRMGAGRRG